MMSPVEFFEEYVRPKLTVDAVYGGSVEFTSRSGRWWRGPCPLHAGTGPNFAVDTASLGFRCHSKCGGGTVIDFVNGGDKARGAAYVECVGKLAEVVGVDAKGISTSSGDEFAAGQLNSHVLDAVITMAQRELQSAAGERARAHLKSVLPAGTDPRDLDVGVFPSMAAVEARLRELGHDAESVELSGVLADRRWPGRLIGAWRDRRGVPQSLFARDLSGAVAPGQKYLLMRGTDKAHLVAFGLDVALAAARREGGELVLGEGFLDAIVPQAAGMLNVAAIAGSLAELSTARLMALDGMRVRRCVLVPDFDPKPKPCLMHERPSCERCAAGTLGAVKAVRAFAATNLTPELFVVPPGLLYEAAGAREVDGAPTKVDPADLVRLKGIDVLRELVAQAVHAFAFLAQHMAAQAAGRKS